MELQTSTLSWAPSSGSLLANKPALTRRLVNRSGRLHELWRDAGGISGTTNLTASANNAPKASGNPFAYVDTANSVQMLLYRGADGGIHCLYRSTGEARHDDLTGSAGAPKATGDPVGWFRPIDGVHHVVYRTGVQQRPCRRTEARMVIDDEQPDRHTVNRLTALQRELYG